MADAPRVVMTIKDGQVFSVVADAPVQIWLHDFDALHKGHRSGVPLPIPIDDNRVIVEYGKYINPDEVQQLRRRQREFADSLDKLFPRIMVPHVFTWDGRSFHDKENIRPRIRTFVQLSHEGPFQDIDTGEELVGKVWRYSTREGAVNGFYESQDVSEHSPLKEKKQPSAVS